MAETDPSHQHTEKLRKEIEDLERELASLKASLPVHSLSAAMFEQIDDLEYRLQQKRAALHDDEPQAGCQ